MRRKYQITRNRVQLHNRFEALLCQCRRISVSETARVLDGCVPGQ
jgi:hypothetical protein